MNIHACSEEPSLLPRLVAFLEEQWTPGVLQSHPVDPSVDLVAALACQPDWQLGFFEDEDLVGTFHGVRVGWHDTPEDGWDRAVRTADPLGTTLIGIAITIRSTHRGRGHSRAILQAVKARAQAAGLLHFRVPVRPNRKSTVPLEDIETYMARTTDEGLSVDPWVRTHQRVGGVVLGPARVAMQTFGSKAEWEAWCGVPLNEERCLPGLLVPLTEELVYREPNVWVDHPL